MCWSLAPAAGDELGERAAPRLCCGWLLPFWRYRDLHIPAAGLAAMPANCLPRMGFRID